MPTRAHNNLGAARGSTKGVSVETTSLERNDGASGLNGRGSASVLSRPQVEMDEKAGTLRVNDARLLNKDRRAFCRRLIQAVARRQGIRKTMIDLASASCRVEFAPGSADLHTMASVFADSVREASAAALDGDGTPWWQPSTNWVALTAYPLAGQVSLWETHMLASESQHGNPSTLLAESTGGGHPIQVASGPLRLLYLAMGAGALVMTVVGLIVPGIPTVPFLLLSSYGFARSSPTMNRWLLETRFLGPIVTEWEQHGGLSRTSRNKLIGLTVVIIVIAVLLAPLSPLGLVLIPVMASLSILGLYRLPGIPEEPPAGTLAGGPTRLAVLGR